MVKKTTKKVTTIRKVSKPSEKVAKFSKKVSKPSSTLRKSKNAAKLVLNPFTGEFVSTTTSLGKRLDFLISLCNKCPEGSIYNYKTKKCVKPSGRIGKILADEIDFCQKYKVAIDAYEKIDVDLVKNIGDIELPKKYLGENVKIKELINVIDDDRVLNKLIKDNLPSNLKDNPYVSLLISVLLVVLKLIAGGGPVSEYVYTQVSKLIKHSNKTFTSIYISSLLNRIKNPDMFNMIYVFSFSGLCLFLVSVYNLFKNFKEKSLKAHLQPLLKKDSIDIPDQKYKDYEWLSLNKVFNIKNIYGLEILKNENIIKEVTEKDGKKGYKINGLKLGILTNNLVREQDIIENVIFNPLDRILFISIKDKYVSKVAPSNDIVLDLEKDISEKSRRKKISDLESFAKNLDETFKRVDNHLQNEQNKLVAFNILKRIEEGSIDKEEYSKEELSNMYKNIENYNSIPDNSQKNLLNNINFLRRYMEESQGIFHINIPKLELVNVNIVYDKYMKDILNYKNIVESLGDFHTAFVDKNAPVVINYPRQAINYNVNHQPIPINYDVKPEVPKTKEQMKKEIEAAEKLRERKEYTLKALYGKPKEKEDPVKVLLKQLEGTTVSREAKPNGSPKKIMPKRRSN